MSAGAHLAAQPVGVCVAGGQVQQVPRHVLQGVSGAATGCLAGLERGINCFLPSPQGFAQALAFSPCMEA